jgi:hypothetical protein
MSKKNYLKFFWKNFRKHDGIDIFVNLIRISRVVFATATLHVHKLPNNRLWIVPYYSLLVWTVLLAQMSPHPQVSCLSKAWFFGIYLNFQQQRSLKNQFLPHSEPKSYQINSIKFSSSRTFQQHQRHIPIPPKFSALI